MKTKFIMWALLWGAFSFAQITQASTFSGTLTIGNIVYHEKSVDLTNLRAHTVIVYQQETIDGNAVSYLSAGIAVDSRHILTVFHAVSDAIINPDHATKIDSFYVPYIGSPSYYLTIKRYDVSHDLALLEIDKNAPDLIAQPIKFAREINIDDEIFTIGHPESKYDLSTGTVSGFHSKGWNDIDSTMLEASILPGNSGGGAVNSNGELVGLVTSGASYIGNIGYMVSAEDMQNFLK